MIVARLVAAAPPSPGEGRRLLRDELARPEYADNWLERLLAWVREHLAFDVEVGGTSWAPLLVVGAVLLAAVAGLVAWRVLAARRRRGSAADGADGLTEAGVTAAEYRERALAHLAAGHTGEAYLDAFRALAAHADASGRVLASPRRTAGALGRALAADRPDLAGDLGRAAATFDAVRYGHADASPAQVEATLSLPARLDATADPAGDRGAPALSAPGGAS